MNTGAAASALYVEVSSVGVGGDYHANGMVYDAVIGVGSEVVE